MTTPLLIVAGVSNISVEKNLQLVPAHTLFVYAYRTKSGNNSLDMVFGITKILIYQENLISGAPD